MESVAEKEKMAREAAEEFKMAGKILSVKYYPEGNINDTFFVEYSLPDRVEKIVLQRVNTKVFQKPKVVMKNMRLVTDYVIKKIAKEDNEGRWHCPGIIKTKKGQDYFENSIGFWRALTFIDNAETLNRVKNKSQAYQAGSVLGWFHQMTNNLQTKSLGNPLPGYHIPSNYLNKYFQAKRTKLGKKRLGKNKFSRELDKFIEKRVKFYQQFEKGKIYRNSSKRISHGDLKATNIMIEKETGRGVGLIDLDTIAVRPLYIDIGDLLRGACNALGEETHDFGKIRFNANFYKAIIIGYMEKASSYISENDKQSLPLSGWFLTFEHVVRFFADFVAGDVYFKIRYPDNNLNRAVVQMCLCESLESEMGKLCQFLGVEKIFKL